VQVDPHVLRAFAGQVDGVAGVVAGANLGNAASTRPTDVDSQLVHDFVQTARTVASLGTVPSTLSAPLAAMSL
jgi:hypothetical protein